MSLERKKMIQTHDFGTIEVATLVSTASFNGGTVQFADDVSTILDIHDKALMVDGYSPCPWGVYQALNQEQPIEYDRTAEINALNQHVYWIWGGVTQGGVGLFKDNYGLLSFIISHGSCINNNNGKKRYWLVYGLSVGNYASRPTALQYHQFAMAYYNQAERKTNLITPFPNDNYSSYVALLIPSGNPTATNQTDPYRYWQLKFETVTVGSVTYDRPYYDPLPNNTNWFGSCNFTDFFDGTNQYYQSVVDNVREFLPEKIFSCSTAYPWSTQYMCLDDERYGLAGYTHELGNWFGEIADEDEDDQGDDGDGDNTQTPSDVPTLDDLNADATDTGFVRIYRPSTAELRGLAHFMFAQLTDDDAEILKKLLVNPLDYIVGLNMCHFTPAVGTYEEDVKLGGISIGDGLGMFPVAKQYVTISGGSYTLIGQKGNYLDYAPFTKIQIYIPYTGMHDLPTDLVQNSTLSLTYVIDLLSGALVAHLSITKNPQFNGEADATDNALVFTYTGNCFTPIPIANSDYRGAVNGMLGLCGGAISSAISGNPMSLFKAGTSAIMNAKPTVQSKASVANDFGFMSGQIAYLIISRPIESKPSKYYEWVGHMCNRIEPVSYYAGGVLTIKDDSLWTSFDNTNITDTETQEIRDLFKLGVCV